MVDMGDNDEGAYVPVQGKGKSRTSVTFFGKGGARLSPCKIDKHRRAEI